MSSSLDRHKGKKPVVKKTEVKKPKPIKYVDDKSDRKPKGLIYVSENDQEKLLEMGKRVEKGEITMGGYATGKFFYWEKK